MKNKIIETLSRHKWLCVLYMLLVINGSVGFVWKELRVWERDLFGISNNMFTWLNVGVVVVLGVFAIILELRWKKMKSMGVAAVSAVLVPAFLVMQLPTSAQVVQATSTTTGWTTGLPPGSIVLKKVNVPVGSTIRKNVDGSVTITDTLGNETRYSRLSFVGPDGKTYEVNPTIVPGKNGEPDSAVWLLVALVILVAGATYALINNWPDDGTPPPPPPPPPPITTNFWPLTGPLPPGYDYLTSCCPWQVIGVYTNVSPPKGKHFWNASSQGGTAIVTMLTEKSFAPGTIDPYLYPWAFMGIGITTNHVNSYHRGRFDVIGGATSIKGPWDPFFLEFWRSGNLGTVVFSDNKGQILFRTTVSRTSDGGFRGERSEGFQVVVDPGEPERYFRFPQAP